MTGILFDGVEHARRRHGERLKGEKEAFAGLVLESFDHPAVQERLRKLFLNPEVSNDQSNHKRR